MLASLASRDAFCSIIDFQFIKNTHIIDYLHSTYIYIHVQIDWIISLQNRRWNKLCWYYMYISILTQDSIYIYLVINHCYGLMTFAFSHKITTIEAPPFDMKLLANHEPKSLVLRNLNCLSLMES